MTAVLRLLCSALMGLLLFVSLSVQAQDKVITGKVIDSKDGSPIVGASVVPKGSTKGASTGADGSFRLNVPATVSALVITSVGFDRQEVAITGATVDVSLVQANASLNEVIVVGYGTSRKKDLTGAVASVKAKDFNSGGAITGPDMLLQNKVPGLEITNTSGQPGVATTVQIRGTSSIRSNNSPLYVVDGVPLDGSTARPNLGIGFGGSTPNSNPLLYIDPNSIASVDVLKDASSAAIYGARGANGVIVITTKKGQAGPMRVDVGAGWGVNTGYMKRFEVLDAGQYRDALKKYKQPATLDGGQDEDALEALTQTGLSQNYSVAFSGGNEQGKFRAGFLMAKTDGFLKKTALDRYLATINGQYKFLDNRLTLDFNIVGGTYGEQLTSVSNNAGSAGNIISSAVSWNPTIALQKADGTYNFPSNGSGNPLAFNEAYNDRSSVTTLLANGSLSYQLTKGLTYKFLYGVNHGVGTRKASIDGWLEGQSGISGVGVAGLADAKLFSQTITNTLNYRTQLSEKLSLDAVIGYEYFKRDYSGGGTFGSGFNTNLSQSARTEILYTAMMQNALTHTVFTYINPTSEIQSYFGRAILNWNDKFALNASLRADGSSKFGSNNRYGYFPAVGARWTISNEDFMKDSKTFNNLALRASWGITGNQEFPPGSSQEQFAFTSFNQAQQVVNGNPDLKWESAQQINFGIDFGLFGGRVFGSLDYYNKNTTDILFQTNAIQPAPSSLSFVNLADAHLINSGFELGVGAVIVQNKDVTWEVTLNGAYNKNNVTDLLDPNTGLPLLIKTGEISGQGVSGTLGQAITNDQPVNIFNLKEFKGFDKTTGNQIIGADPVIGGDPNPSWITGFSTTLRLKKFSFTLNAGGAYGFLIYNNTATSVTNIAGIAQGRNIDVAAYESEEGVGSGVAASQRFLEKGNYMKLRNFTVSYNVGSMGKFVKNFTAYVTGSNLFVLTNFTGFDPEVNIDKSNNSYPSRSIEYVPYPTPRVVTFGLNFSL